MYYPKNCCTHNNTLYSSRTLLGRNVPFLRFISCVFQVFGERGVHSRSAVGTNALPMNVPVEIEAIVEFASMKKDDDDWTVLKRP